MHSLIDVRGVQVRVRGRFLRIARLEADMYLFLDDPDDVLTELRRRSTRIDLFTFIQRVPDTTPKFNYPIEWDNFAALPISSFEHWWNHQIGFKARNKAKQAQKRGVIVREVPFGETLAKGIWEIYNESSVRQGQPNKHFGKDLQVVYQEEVTFLENSVFIGAFLGEKLIGFIKLVHDGTGTQAGMMNIVSMVQHRDKAPTNALVAQAVRSCADRGIRNLVYSRFAYAKKERSSLTEFKERNGFKKVDVPRYYVALSGVGELALRLGLHKQLVEHIPAPVVVRLRALRDAWYRRKLDGQSIAESS